MFPAGRTRKRAWRDESIVHEVDCDLSGTVLVLACNVHPAVTSLAYHPSVYGLPILFLVVDIHAIWAELVFVEFETTGVA